MPVSMSNSTVIGTVFDYDVRELDVLNATIDRCNFKGEINKASITGSLIKCLFEKLTEDIAIKGPILDMTVLVDLTPSSAQYVQDRDVPSKLLPIATLKIDNVTVPRLIELPHKECFINIIDPGSKVTFIVLLSTDDTNPRGVIIMFYPGAIPAGLTIADVIPKGYAICDGNNGTPDLTGKFIRMVGENEDVGPKPNDTLYQPEGSNRYNSIKITEYNLPDHVHLLNLTFDLIHVSGQTDSALSTTILIPSYSTSSQTVSTSGDSTTNITVISGSSYNNESLGHYHNFDGYDNIVPHIDWPANDNFRQDLINIEPNAYALIFIMKL